MTVAQIAIISIFAFSFMCVSAGASPTHARPQPFVGLLAETGAQAVALEPGRSGSGQVNSNPAEQPAHEGNDDAAHDHEDEWGSTFGISNELLGVGAASSIVGLCVALTVGEYAGGLAASTIVGLFILHLPVHMMIWGAGGIAAWEGAKWALGMGEHAGVDGMAVAADEPVKHQ